MVGRLLQGLFCSQGPEERGWRNILISAQYVQRGCNVTGRATAHRFARDVLCKLLRAEAFSRETEGRGLPVKLENIAPTSARASAVPQYTHAYARRLAQHMSGQHPIDIIADCRRPCLVSPAAGDSLSRYGKKETYRRNRTSHRTGWLFGLCRLCTCRCYTSYFVIGCEDRPFRVRREASEENVGYAKKADWANEGTGECYAW